MTRGALNLTGLEVSRAYYAQLVRPLLATNWPDLRYACARLGSGSEVLGLDDAMSRDHDWGLRLTLLVSGQDPAPIDRLLAAQLPDTFRGLPTRFATSHDPEVRHRVHVSSPQAFARSLLGLEIAEHIPAPDWLTMTGQALLELTAGDVYVDCAGDLTRMRSVLAWYPHDVWLHVLAADWAKLAEELPLVGRAGQRGDDTGSRVLAARLCRTLMHLGFMLERRWPPYPKWLGTLFARLPTAGAAGEELARAMAAATWQERQAQLAAAAAQLYRAQREAGLPCIAGEVSEPFYSRPFRTIRQGVIDVLRDAIIDPNVRALPAGLGAVEQWVDDVAVLTTPGRRIAAVRGCLAAWTS